MANKPRQFDYDLLVIGSGAGGGVAAHIAIREGKNVAIVEDEKIGGECPNFGCVPTKALITAAEAYKSAKNGAQYGLKATNVSFNYLAVKKWQELAVYRTGTSEGEEAFAAEGIATIKGHAHFLNPHEVSVGKKRFTAKKFLIATGTKNFVPPIEGLKEAGFIGHREALNFSKLPKSLFIIGGGAIGCEFASIFNTFDVKITQAEFSPRLLAREDPEVGQLTKALFERDGITVHTSTEVVKVTTDRAMKVVHFKKDGKIHTARVEEVMIAAGQVPNTDLGLENAGVTYGRHGIEVNDMMQTSAKHIYAAGDVVGPYAFTHMASYQSRIASHNMFKRNKIVAQYHAVPRCVFTSPEIAAVGITEAEAKERGIKIKTNAVPISVIGRANVSNESAGFVKVIASKTGVLLGASIIAPRAGEMMQELALAIHNGLKAEDVTATIHAFPTWSEAVRVACAGLE